MNILNNLCRACNIKKDNLINIHEAEECIKGMLQYCLQTTLTKESKYPKFICYDCLKQLEISYRFIKRFHLSQREFEESYNCLQRFCGEINDVHISESSVEQCCDDGLKTCSLNILEGSQTVNSVGSLSSGNSIPIKIENNLKYNHVSENVTQTRKSMEMCTHCNMMFYTKKALNLHTKLSHKQKVSNI